MTKAFILACLIAFCGTVACAVTPPYPAAAVPGSPNDVVVCWQGGVTKNCLVGNISGELIAPSYPFTMHVSATGTDAGNCLTIATSCHTLQYAVNQALKFNFFNQSNIISLDGGGTFAGAIVSGAPIQNGAGGISGQYLVINGNGTATISAAPGQVFNIEASSGAQVIVENFTCAVASGNTCTFAQNSGTVLQFGASGAAETCQMASGSAGCLYAEGDALLEMSTGQTITIQGTTSCAVEAASGAVTEFDPGTATISTGTGLTITGGGGFLCPQGGFITWAWSTVSGTATGDLIKATLGGRLAYLNTPPSPPGNGFVRMNVGTVLETGGGAVVYAPSIGTCSSNCSLQAGATNYDMNVIFTGAATNATITFGKPSNATAYFTAIPACTTGFIAGSAAAIVISGPSNTGLTIGTTGSFANNEIVSIHCAPPNGG
jgi:hypothetical protein